ncbi:MAG: glycerate kinase, partial [Microbacterium sp.]
MTRVVVALDSFKGSIAAARAAEAFADGWRRVDPAADLVLRPMADGGEGTLDAFAAAVPGARRIPVRVRGPRGDEVEAWWLLLPDGTGVVELAGTSGIELLGDERRPWDADTFGFGQAISAALAHGVRRLVLGVGSSASTDGGAGLLAALGARFTDVDGAPVEPGARGLTRVAHADLSALAALPPDGAVVLTDVTNPLRGAEGAAAVFGPQKGLRADDVPRADAALGRFAALLPVDPALPAIAGAGAAGG